MIRKIYSGGLRFNDVSDVSRNKFQRSLQELVVGKRKRVERLTTGGGRIVVAVAHCFALFLR